MKRADVVLHFDQAEGILEGGRLEGFAIFEHAGGELRVTMPARKYTINGESRAYAILRGSPEFIRTIEGEILRAWRELTKAKRTAHMTRRPVALANGGSVDPDGFEWAPNEPAQVKP